MTLYVSASCPRARHRRHRRRATKGGACGSGRQTRLQASPPRGRHTRTLGRTPDPVPLRVRASRSPRCCALARRRRCALRTSIPHPRLPSDLAYPPVSRLYLESESSTPRTGFLRTYKDDGRGAGWDHSIRSLPAARFTDCLVWFLLYLHTICIALSLPPWLIIISMHTHHPLTFD